MKLQQSDKFLICWFDDKEIRTAGEYWTKERMEMVVPQPMPVLNDESVSPKEIQTLPSSDANLSVPPYKFGGRLLFQRPSGHFGGSAQFFGQSNIVLTAAHCIYSRSEKVWSSQFRFMRAFRNWRTPAEFSVRAMGILTAWRDLPDPHPGTMPFHVDYGFLVTTTNSDVGCLKYKLELPQTATSFGYPGNIQSGEVMQTVTGDIADQSNGTVNMDGNPFREGASGGAWTDSQNNIIGVTAFRRSDMQGHHLGIGGPLLDKDFQALYDFVVRETS